MSKLKIGVLGAHRGKTMINILMHYPNAELVAVCDKYEPSLESVRQTAAEKGVDVTFYNNFEDFLAHDMDAVVLANYAHQHAPFAIRCLKAGKHVMSEVLPCATIAEGVQLIEAVEETGLVYAFAENYCYMQHTFEMWKRIKTGEIGEINYAEGEYVHDSTSIKPIITYGDPHHWRNYSHPNFYCTHSFGPMMMTIGKRPVKAMGFELPNFHRGGTVPGKWGCGGIEMITLENGCVCRSLHGSLRREHEHNNNYMFFGDFGCMETARFKDMPLVNIYKEGDKFCEGSWERYTPAERTYNGESIEGWGHMGSDFYPIHFFIEKILGTDEGKEWSIDVYQAVDMGICGILSLRSRLLGGVAQDVPDLRDKAQRDLYRNDWDTTNPTVENGHLVPGSLHKSSYPTDEKFWEYIRQLYENDMKFEEYPF